MNNVGYLGYAEKLSRSSIHEINCDLLDYFMNEQGGSLISGATLGAIYEIRHGISNHGFHDDKIYRIHIKIIKENLHVLIEEINVPIRNKK